MRSYVFMNKIINFPTKHFNLVEYVCKGNHSMSERFAYLLLHNCSKVTMSDGAKPVISAIHEFVSIEDDIPKQVRAEWIVGFPQYIEHHRTSSFGIYGISPEHDYLVSYISAVGGVPIYQQLIKFKTKAPHVAVLLTSMLLQL